MPDDSTESVATHSSRLQPTNINHTNSSITRFIYFSNDSQQNAVSSGTAVVYNAKHVLRSRKSEQIFADGITACPQKRRPLEDDIKLRNGRWQHTEEGGEAEVVVFSAFFDDRPLLGVITWLRILGVATLNPSAQKQLACYVWYGDYEAPYVVPVQLERTGRSEGYEFNNSTYVQYLYSCQLPGIIPVHEYVSLVTSNCGASSIYLPVTTTNSERVWWWRSEAFQSPCSWNGWS